MTESLPMTFTEPLSATETATMQGWLRADLQSGRISQSQYDAATSSQPTTPPIVPTSPAVPTVTQGPVTALSIAERLKAGTLTTAQAGSLARSGNIAMLEVAKAHSVLTTPVEAKAPESQSPEVQLLNRDFPAGKPEEYVIRYGDAGQEPTMTPEMIAFDKSARTWLSSSEMPSNIGNSLINEITRVTQHTKAVTADQLESYGYSEFEKLRHVYGDKLEDKLNQAGRMIHEVDAKQPGLKNLLKAKGIGDNAMVASLIIQQSERYFNRRT